MGYFFDENYYLSTRLAQLRNAGEKDQEDGAEFTFASLHAALTGSGMTVREHYEQHGRDQGLNPNQYFNENEYLSAKLKQMHSIGEKDSQGGAYTLESLRAALERSGLLPVEFYELFGSYETDADGYFVNPSNAFDVNAFFQARLLQIWLSGECVGGKAGTNVTMSDLLASMARSCASPVTHYLTYGVQESEASGIPLVQSVPMSQRVPEDPARESTGQTVPPNNGPPTPAPETVTSPQAPSTGTEDRAPAPERLATFTSLTLNSLLLFTDASFKLDAPASGAGAHLPLLASFPEEGALWPDLDGDPGAEGASRGWSGSVPENGCEADTDPAASAVADSQPQDQRPAGSGVQEGDSVFPQLAQRFPFASVHAGYAPFSLSELAFAAPFGPLSFSLSGGDVRLSGLAGNTVLRVEASGRISGLSGVAVLGEGGLFDASGVTGSGVLYVDFSDFKGEYAVQGSLTARNVFQLGALVTSVQGGANDDTFIVHAGHANPDTVFALGGSGLTGDVLALASGATGDVRIGPVTGGDNDDTLLLRGAGAQARLLVESVDLGSGLNTLVVENALLMSPLVSEGGENVVILHAGGAVQDIIFNGAEASDRIEVHSGGVAGDIRTGGGDDMVALYGNGRIGHLDMGAGDDLVVLTAGASWSGIDGGAGFDTLRVEGEGVVILEDVSNIDVLDLSGDGEAQTVFLADSVRTGENGLSTIRFDREEDVVILNGTALNNIQSIENTEEGQGAFLLSDSESLVLRSSSFVNGAIAELRFKGQQNAVMDAETLGKIARITGEDGDNTLTITGDDGQAASSVDLSLTSISRVSSLLFQSSVIDVIIAQGSLGDDV